MFKFFLLLFLYIHNLSAQPYAHPPAPEAPKAQKSSASVQTQMQAPKIEIQKAPAPEPNPVPAVIPIYEPSIKLPPDYPQQWKSSKIKISKPSKLMGKQMGRVDTIGIQPLGYEQDGNIKVFRLVAQPVEATLLDVNKSELKNVMPHYDQLYKTMETVKEQKVKCWGYNGSCPGPTIEINEGDTVRIIVTNELPEPTSVHWHGLELPNSQDGAAPETQRPIMPGETYTYEFTVHQSGTYMYHSGFNEMKQSSWGLQGMFVVHPKAAEHRIDKDVAIMLQEWSIFPDSKYPNLVATNFNWFTFNGRAAPTIPVISVEQGQRVRLRFGNVSMDSHPIHIHGYSWEEVGTDGGTISPSARIKSSTVNVPPGTTRDVEFVAWNPGIWRLHCHKLHHITNAHGEAPLGIMAPGGMFTLIHVIPHSPQKTATSEQEQP